MRVRFWGTRGSIPVSLTAADIRDRLAQVLVRASGRTFASYEEAHAFASTQLDTPLVFAALLLVSVLGIAFYYAAEILERIVVPWAPKFSHA